ncbi:PoNi-like cognate immunity protein [Pseudomonas fontis]|uniref:PoNi-like cognate immunity protein n=1 Tax=Pseudomonas fontis TaxID=2942633 RepID=A0ABT5NTN7_9PSED|nr:PoNi-like cognate immunity protein [Pseudomonas fontis]MDD0976096.1 PoNi-like cognate immunity protein [Pseudomonas fontis]MDD0991546.1 PoNi-like cognate immunity protein [Pseudomonas fontis]
MRDFNSSKREPLLAEAAYHSSVKIKQDNYVNVTFDAVRAEQQRTAEHERGLSFDWAFGNLELLIQLYSGGEPLENLLAAANRTFDEFERHKKNFPDFYLLPWEPDAYQYTLWLLSLSVLFDLPERAKMIATYVGSTLEDGQDSLLRQLYSRVGVSFPGDNLIHVKPYAELQSALNACGDEQQQLMARYLKHWYQNMKKCYWYGRDKRPAAGFFGYWAFEAGMVTVLWDIDDTVYRDLPYYPKDLVDYARAKHVADHFPRGRLIGTPGMTAKSGEECPCTGVWICDDWAVGPQTFSRGITLPTDSGRQVTWRLTKVI